MAEQYLDAGTVRRLLGDVPSDALPKAGDLVAGKYRILGTLGAGGVALVLEAHHTLLDKTVALKLLAPEASSETFALRAERFLVEARAAAKIDSPHVARVLDVGTLDSGAPFIVMERLEGCNLEELLLLEERLSVKDATDYIVQALQGLRHAHALGVVHRDLKPANLFLAQQPDGSTAIKILDFGIALLDSADGGQATGGNIIGSPVYMSPEQVRNDASVDHRTDIWSIGTVLYELITGKVPFGASAEGLGELFGAILDEPFVPPSHHREELPSALDAVVAKALERDVNLRYADVTAFEQALAPFAVVSAEAAPTEAAVVREPPRRSGRWWLVIAALILATGWAMHVGAFTPVIAWVRHHWPP
jgi:serine/threonine protein kinase